MAPRPIIRPRAPVSASNRLRLGRAEDIAVRQHRAVQLARRPRDQIVAHAGPVHLRHRARVDGEQVNRMLGEQRQQRVELSRRLETDARLDGERNRHRVAQRAEDGVNFLRLAQQAAARAFAINDRRGTAEIQLNCGDGMVAAIPPRCG